MNDSLRRRLNFIGLILSVIAGLITWRLVSLQFYVDSEIVNYLAAQALTEYRDQVMIHPPRGELYDRNGVLRATNAFEYEIGLSPVLILYREGTAKALAEATGLPEHELLLSM